ncbi:MAG: protein-glutamate O-methyltransferase [Pseudomonadota bacterium]
MTAARKEEEEEQLREREFVFTDKDFFTIQDLVKKHSGIVLSDAKRNMVYSRLSRRLRQLNLTEFSSYIDMLSDPSGHEMVNFINAITTNLTSFFREMHHFEYLAETVLPELMRNNPARRIRIWSAGCSTGEEPYSIAITLQRAIPKIETWDIKILATDLDTNVLTRAKNGVYDAERIADVASDVKQKYFLHGGDTNPGKVRVNSEVRELVTFNQLNLMNGWPMKGPFDVIFCRNVVIYFDKPTQKVLFERYADLLVKGGHLFIGHSESLFKVTNRFKLIGNTIYQRCA